MVELDPGIGTFDPLIIVHTLNVNHSINKSRPDARCANQNQIMHHFAVTLVKLGAFIFG